MTELIKKWRRQAAESLKESARISATMDPFVPIDTQIKCETRAKLWNQCANELEAVLKSWNVTIEVKSSDCCSSRGVE